MGGECLTVSKDLQDSDPNSVGTAHWLSGPTPDTYGVRRNAKNHYDMFLNGALAGTIARDDNWIKVRFTGKTFSLRDDPPGFLN